MKKVVQTYENIYNYGNKIIIYKAGIVKESLLSSILSDTYTFGILIFSFWVNHQFIQSRIVSSILLFCFILSLIFKSAERTISKEEFKQKMDKYLEDMERKEDENGRRN
jgi:hypothetical protein